MDPLTPDPGMTDYYSAQSSLGKRDHPDESDEEKISQPAPAGALNLCDSKKKPALEEAIGPKNLGKLMQSEPALPPEAGGTDKNMEISGDSALQRPQPAAEAEALRKGSTETEQMQNYLGGLTKEQMIEFGYSLDTLQAYRASVSAAPKAKPVLVLGLLGRFSINLFCPVLQENLAKDLTANMENETAKVGIYEQIDINGSRNSVLTVECSERVYAHYYGEIIDYKDEENLFKFKGTSLTEWLGKVGAIDYLGTTFAFNMGPMPSAPTDDTIQMLAPLLAMYGKMTHIIYYADRTITVGVALGDMPMPLFRKPIPLFDGGVYAGKLDPTHNIRLMGVPCCSFCPGIGDYHSGECATNKEKQEAFLARKKKLAEKNKATPIKPTKPIRRGNKGGLREVERTILKENKMI